MGHPANFQFDHAFGTVYGWFTSRGLYRLELPHTGMPPERRAVLHSSVNDARGWKLHAALDRYFAGVHEAFQDVPLDVDDATPFQQEVWEAARGIAWGKTATYGELTAHLGKPKEAARAVGRALGANRIAILIPCHRFLAANGALCGFAAGLEWKQELLRIERSLLA
jgi:O-6-methylguanine DNA methyltransferase